MVDGTECLLKRIEALETLLEAVVDDILDHNLGHKSYGAKIDYDVQISNLDFIRNTSNSINDAD